MFGIVTVCIFILGLNVGWCTDYGIMGSLGKTLDTQYYTSSNAGNSAAAKKTSTATKSGSSEKKISFQSLVNQSVFDIYDFHVPQFPSVNSSVILACGFKETEVAKLHELKWLKDGSTFFSYQPWSRQVITVIPDNDWLKANTLSHMKETINLHGDNKEAKDGYNLTVVYIRLSGVTEDVSGAYTCQLSMSIPHTITGVFTLIRMRTGQLTVTSGTEQTMSPVVKLGARLGYKKGDPINIFCSISGQPAPHIVWKYISVDDDDEEVEEEVGQGRLQIFPLKVSKDGTETRKVGIHIICCTQTKLSCNLINQDNSIVRTVVQVLEHGDSWRLDAVQENSGLEEAEELSDDEEDEDVEDEMWSDELMLGVGISSGVLVLMTIICICCCCCSCKQRRARRLRSREINRREIYSINTSERSRVRSLGRRSTKRKAPLPSYNTDTVPGFQREEEPLTISP